MSKDNFFKSNKTFLIKSKLFIMQFISRIELLISLISFNIEFLFSLILLFNNLFKYKFLKI